LDEPLAVAIAATYSRANLVTAARGLNTIKAAQYVKRLGEKSKRASNNAKVPPLLSTCR
jgi:hypothetical protein